MQALADSALYTVAALYLSGVACVAYAILRRVGATSVEYLPLAPYHWLLPLGCFALGYFIYRVSLHTHAQFGETFKTVFDQFGGGADFGEVLKRIAALTHDPALETADARTRNMAVWRYLHNYRLKCPRCGKVIHPSEAGAHAEPHTQPPAA